MPAAWPRARRGSRSSSTSPPPAPRGAPTSSSAAMRSIPRGSRLVIAFDGPTRHALRDARGGPVAAPTSARRTRMSAAEVAVLAAGRGWISAPRTWRRCARTDGWPPGVSLLARAAAADQRRRTVLGGYGRVGAGRRGVPRRRFWNSDAARGLRSSLADSSVIETPERPACDAALQRNDSGRALRRLAPRRVPMTALDQRGEEYRLNPLLRDMLAQELDDDPDAVTALHLRRASGASSTATSRRPSTTRAKRERSSGRASSSATRFPTTCFAGEVRSASSCASSRPTSFGASTISPSPGMGRHVLGGRGGRDVLGGGRGRS